MGAEEWMATDVGRLWVAYQVASQTLDAEMDRRLRAEAGLSHAEFQILAWLARAPGRRLRMGVLATRLISPKTRLNYRVGKLEERGLLRREPDPEDGRALQATLTGAGYAAVERAVPVAIEAVEELFAGAMTEGDRTRLLRTMQRIAERVGAPDGA